MKKKKKKRSIKVKARYWLLSALVVLVSVGLFRSHWDLLIPASRVVTSDPEAVGYRIDKDHYFLDWGGEIYVLDFSNKTIVMPSRYGHHFLKAWIWPKGLENYRGVLVGDQVKSSYGKYAFVGRQVYLEHPRDHSVILECK